MSNEKKKVKTKSLQALLAEYLGKKVYSANRIEEGRKSNDLMVINKTNIQFYSATKRVENDTEVLDEVKVIRTWEFSEFSSVKIDKFALSTMYSFDNGMQVRVDGSDELTDVLKAFGVKAHLLDRKWYNKILGFRSKNKWKMAVASLFYLFIIFVVGDILIESDAEKSEKAAMEVKVAEEQAAAKIEKEKKEAEEKERKANRTIDEAILEDNDDVNEATLNDGRLTIVADGKTTFSENTLFLSVYDLFEAMRDGFQDESVTEVYVELMTTMVDTKGNESVEPVIKYNYNRKSFEELNYENFTNMAYSEEWRILREADYYYIHPGIYKELKAKYKDNLSVEGFK